MPFPCLALPPFFCLMAEHGMVIVGQISHFSLFFSPLKEAGFGDGWPTTLICRTNPLFLHAYTDFRSEKYLV